MSVLRRRENSLIVEIGVHFAFSPRASLLQKKECFYLTRLRACRMILLFQSRDRFTRPYM